ncbi:ABC transporter permease [Streptomyces sp. NPDC001978]|uniref:ABC transporter permease n=1 Tax=Streptomyces sp. NPDC001978 TaxID=3364627 RepID=UPI00368A000A
MKRFGDSLQLLEKYGLAILLVVVIAFFTLDPATPQFASIANIKSVLSNETLTGIIALASIFPLVGGQFDLSLGPSMGLSSLICAGVMSKMGLPLWVAVIAAILTGMLVGAVNGLAVTKIKVSSIVTTLGMTSIIAALVTWYTGGNSIIDGVSPALTNLGTGEWLGIPCPLYFLAVVAIISWYLLQHTPWGRSLQGVGANPRAAEIVGLPVNRLTLQSFVLGGALAGIGGVLLLAVSGSGNPSVGPGYLLPALAAALLGATTINPGRFNVPGTLVAVYFLAATVSGLTFLGAKPWVSSMFNGVALIVAVGISVWSGLGRQNMGKAEGGEGDVDPAAATGSGPNKGAVTTSVS